MSTDPMQDLNSKEGCTSTMFPEPCFRQTHTARHQQMKRKDFPVWLLGKSWLLLEKQTSLHCHGVLGRQGSLVVRLTFMPGLSCLQDISWVFFEFCGINGCWSASLKLFIWKAVSPWTQIPSSKSQCTHVCSSGHYGLYFGPQVHRGLYSRSLEAVVQATMGCTPGH